MFEELMTDTITIEKQNGEKFQDVKASVQKKGIFTERTDIPIEAGDRIFRRTPAGVEELFIVDDPGFTKGIAGIRDTYQMQVHRADRPPSASGVVYNVTGPNARINIGSSDSSINVINQVPDQLFETLREAIRNDVENAETKARLLEKAEELEREVGTDGYLAKYAEFVQLAANHVTLLAPFLPALLQLARLG